MASLSIRRAQQQLNVSYGSLHGVTHILRLIPHKVRVVHELSPGDPEDGVNFCHWFQKFLSDEAWFYLSGYVNTHNTRYWSFTNPNQEIKAPQSQRIGVWCAVSRRRIVGPLFFTTSINSERYCEIFQQFSAMLEPSERYLWFQQDNATANTSQATTNLLKEFFDERLIFQGL